MSQGYKYVMNKLLYKKQIEFALNCNNKIYKYVIITLGKKDNKLYPFYVKNDNDLSVVASKCYYCNDLEILKIFSIMELNEIYLEGINNKKYGQVNKKNLDKSKQEISEMDKKDDSNQNNNILINRMNNKKRIYCIDINNDSDLEQIPKRIHKKP